MLTSVEIHTPALIGLYKIAGSFLSASFKIQSPCSQKKKNANMSKNTALLLLLLVFLEVGLFADASRESLCDIYMYHQSQAINEIY